MDPVDNVVTTSRTQPSHPFMSNREIDSLSVAVVRRTESDKLTGSIATNCFTDVETSCNGDALLVVASLQEPFFGLLYANGFATTPSCRVEGAGSRLLRLALNASECGIHLSQTEV